MHSSKSFLGNPVTSIPLSNLIADGAHHTRECCYEMQFIFKDVGTVSAELNVSVFGVPNSASACEIFYTAPIG